MPSVVGRHRSRPALLALAVVLSLMTTACAGLGGGDESAEPEPTPEPTAEPTAEPTVEPDVELDPLAGTGAAVRLGRQLQDDGARADGPVTTHRAPVLEAADPLELTGCGWGKESNCGNESAYVRRSGWASSAHAVLEAASPSVGVRLSEGRLS